MRNGYIKGLRAEQDRNKAIADALNSGTTPVQVERPNVVREYAIGDLATYEQIESALDPTDRKCNLFTDSQDIQWAIETHARETVGREDIASILMYGNEDAPVQVWGSSYNTPWIHVRWERLA